MDNTGGKNLNLKNIGSRIRAERELLKLSRESLAELSELSPFYIGQIERGERRMSLNTLVMFANLFNTSVDYLLFGCNLHNRDMEMEKFHIMHNSINEDLADYKADDLKDLLTLLSRCSGEEIRLIKDMVTLLLPYIK